MVRWPKSSTTRSGWARTTEHIASLDTGGVALAAIQGLADRIEEKNDRIDELEAQAETAREEAATAREQNTELESTIDDLREQNADLAARLEAVENQLDPVAAD